MLRLLLLSCRVFRPNQPGLSQPPGEEEAGLHPRADRGGGEICGGPAGCTGCKLMKVAQIKHDETFALLFISFLHIHLIAALVAGFLQADV